MADSLQRVLVIVPTYNEIENLPIAVAKLRKQLPTVDVLVVDDNSPDGTGALADSMSEQDTQVHVLHRQGKQGLGAAYLAAFAWAKDHAYDVVVEMDADGSHQASDLPKILSKLESHDAVLGSRWVHGGRVENWPMSRKILSRGGNWYTRIMLGIPLKDATGGFRAFRVPALDRIDLHSVQSQGYCFQVDLAWRTVRAGLRICEVPITFIERTKGESKMSREIVFEALWLVTLWGVRHRIRQLTQLVIPQARVNS